MNSRRILRLIESANSKHKVGFNAKSGILIFNAKYMSTPRGCVLFLTFDPYLNS